MANNLNFSITLNYLEVKNKTIKVILKENNIDLSDSSDEYSLVINGIVLDLKDIEDEKLETVIYTILNNKIRKSERLKNTVDYNELNQYEIRLNFTKNQSKPISKKRTFDTIDNSSYNTADSVNNGQRSINFQFNNLSAFIQFVLKQFVLDKLHDTVIQRLMTGTAVKSEIKKRFKGISEKNLKGYILRVRKMFRSPIIAIWNMIMEDNSFNKEQIENVFYFLCKVFKPEMEKILDSKIGKNLNSVIKSYDKNFMSKCVIELLSILDKDTTANCSSMEELVLALELEEPKDGIVEKQDTKKMKISAETGSCVIVDNASALKEKYMNILKGENGFVLDGMLQQIDGSSPALGRVFNLDSPIDRLTPCRFRFEVPGHQGYYVSLEVVLSINDNGEPNGRAHFVTTICINGNVQTSSSEEVDICSSLETIAATTNADFITEVMVQLINNPSLKYHPSMMMDKALGDFLKTMQFFLAISGQLDFVKKSDYEENFKKCEKVTIAATDRMSSAIAIELLRDSSFPISDWIKEMWVLVTHKGVYSAWATTSSEKQKDKQSYSGAGSGAGVKTSGLQQVEYFNYNNERYEIITTVTVKGNGLCESLEKGLNKLGINIMEIKVAENDADLIQMYANNHNISVIIFDSNGIIQRFVPNNSGSQSGVIYLRKTGDHFDLLIKDDNRTGGSININNVPPEIDMEKIIDLKFILSCSIINNLQKIQEYQKNFLYFLSFLSDNKIADTLNKKITLNTTNGKSYDFYTDTLRYALFIYNKISSIEYISYKGTGGQIIKKYKKTRKNKKTKRRKNKKTKRRKNIYIN